MFVQNLCDLLIILCTFYAETSKITKIVIIIDNPMPLGPP
jgi:hypothetical protein